MTGFEAYTKLCEAAGVLDEMLSTTDPKLARGIVGRMQNNPNLTQGVRKAVVNNLRTALSNQTMDGRVALERMDRARVGGNNPTADMINKVVNRSGSFQPSTNHYSTVMDAAQRLNKRGNI